MTTDTTIQTADHAEAARKLLAIGARQADVEILVERRCASEVLAAFGIGYGGSFTQPQRREAVHFAAWALLREHRGSALDHTVREMKVEPMGSGMDDVHVFVVVGLREEKGLQFMSRVPRSLSIGPMGGFWNTRKAKRGTGRVMVHGPEALNTSGDGFSVST